MSRFPKILGAILIALGIIGAVTAGIASPSLIVAIGVRAIQTLMITSCVVGGVGVLLEGIGFVPNIKRLVERSNNQKAIEGKIEERQKTFDEYAKDSLNPLKTRERFDDLREANPNLTSLIERCIKQMDKMDKLQDRYQSLISANDATYLESTISVIDDAETRLCRNMRNIINCCILVEDGSDDLSDFDNEIIEKSLSENENELKNVDTLIHYAVNYINNYQQNGVTDMSELRAWIEVMRKSTEGEK